MTAWWRVDGARPAQLRTAASPDGGISWDTAATVGTAPVAPAGCVRPPPGIGTDAATGAVYVAYSGNADGQVGILLRRLTPGALPTDTVLLVSPAQAGRAAAVASFSDTTVVAYEGTGSAAGEIWLAIFNGSEHIPYIVGRISTAGVRAFSPVVAIGGASIAVAWNERAGGAGAPSVVARIGRITR